MHAKTALIDGVWSTIGSTNLDWLSLEHNQEINAVILGQEFGTQMKALFDEDIKSSRLVTLEKWRQRPILTRIKEFGAEFAGSAVIVNRLYTNNGQARLSRMRPWEN